MSTAAVRAAARNVAHRAADLFRLGMRRGPVSAVGDAEVVAGLGSLLEILADLGMRKELSERSSIIARVHRAFDDLEDLEDDEDFLEAYNSSLADLRIRELTASEAGARREELKRKVAAAADKVLVAAIDARDLIDTGEFRFDVAHRAWIFEDRG